MPSACFNSYDRDGILSEEKWLRRPCLPRFGVPRRRPARKKKRGERSLKFAFGVHSFAQAGAWASHLTRIDLVTAGGKVSTGHSGLEVDRAARAFRAWLIAKSRDSRPYTYASERLKDVPVWMANTAVDIVIQKRKARAFIGALKRNNSSAVLREELWVPYSKVVRHDAIITPSNPDLPVIKDSLREFLGQIH